jgi:hypothetical protein
MVNIFSIIVVVIRLLNFIASRIQLTEARKQVLAEEILKLEVSLKITRKIVKDVEALTEDEIDVALRG